MTIGRLMAAAGMGFMLTLGWAPGGLATAVGVEETRPGLFQGGPTPLSQNLFDLVQEFRADHSRGLNDLGMADARAESDSAFRDLSRGQAQEIFLDGFGELVGLSVRDPGEPVASADEVVVFDGESSAVVDPEGSGKRSLVVSSAPLSRDADRPIDVGLEEVAGGFEPIEPVVPVVFPQKSDGSVRIAGDIEMAFKGTSGSAPAGSLVEVSPGGASAGDLVFYPNAYLDTDLAVSAVREGVETFTHIRSSRGPEQFEFGLDVPIGASLTGTDDGGVELVSSDAAKSLTVHAPFGVDSDGKRVPVSLDVAGSDLRLVVDHREGDFRYPILVDPLFDAWDWHSQTYATNWTIFPGWGPYSVGTPVGNYELSTECNPALANSCNASGTGTGQGLHVRALPGHTYPASSLGVWRYFVPGNDSYIFSASVGPYRYLNNRGVGYPMAHWGLRRSVTDGWKSWASRTTSSTGTGPVLSGDDTDPAKRARVFEAGLYSGTTNTIPAGTVNTIYNRTAAMTLELRDGGPPALSPVDITAMPAWVNGEPFPVAIHATDNGLGLKRVVATTYVPGSLFTVEYQTAWPSTVTCTGGVRAVCPAATPPSANLNFDPSGITEGRQPVIVQASDALEKVSSPEFFHVQVDHTGPSVQVSGSATDQVSPGTELTIEAQDRQHVAGGITGSGIKSVIVKLRSGTDPWEEVYSEEIACTGGDGSCPREIKRTISIPVARLIEPDVEMRVEVRDQVGLLGREGTFVPEWQPEPPPVAATTEAATASCPSELQSAAAQKTISPPTSATTVVGTNCADRIILDDKRYKGIVTVNGLGGDDLIVTNEGNQKIWGGGGDDTIVSGIHNDELKGESGDDILVGGTADDLLVGNEGDDILIGNHGFDTMLGQAGNDYLRGGQGGDFMGGGSGTDTVSFAEVLTPGFNTDPNLETVQFGGWLGFPDVGSEDRGVYVNLAGSVAGHPDRPRPTASGGPPRLGGGLDILCSRGKDKRKQWASMANPLCAGRDVERVEGSAFSDFIVGSSRSETLLGGSGDDLIVGREGTDRIYGGYGNDGLDGAGTSHLDGGPGSDSCRGRSLPDTAAGCEATLKSISPVPRGQGPVRIGLVHPDDATSDPALAKPIFADVYLRGSDLGDNVGIRYDAVSREMRFTVGAAPKRGGRVGFFDSSSDDEGCSAGLLSAVCGHTGQRLGSLVVSGGGGEDSLAIRESAAMRSFGDQQSINMTGGFGSDLLQGGRSDDQLIDGDHQGDFPGREVTIGARGDDVLIENRGSDRAEGGADQDLLMSTAVCANDLIDGGGQSDNSQWVQLAGRFPDGRFIGAYVNLSSGIIGSTSDGGSSSGSGFPESNACPADSSGEVVSVERVEGSNASDFIRGDERNNRILGRAGRDTMLGGPGGFDRIQANDGWDPSRHRDQISCESGGGAARINYRKRAGSPVIDPIPSGCKTRKRRDSRYGDNGPKEDKGETGSIQAVQSSSPGATGAEEGEDDEETDESMIPGEFADAWEASPSLGPDEADPAEAMMFLPLSEAEGDAAYDALTETVAAEFAPADTWTAPDPGDGPELQVTGVDPPATSAVRLDGIDDEIRIESTPEEEVADPSRLSVELVVRFDEGPGGDQYVYSTGGESAGIHLFRDGEGFIVFESRSGHTVYRAVSHEPVLDGAWHQLNGVLDGTRVAVSVDGEESRVDFWESVAPSTPGPDVTNVGTSFGASNTALTVDDVIEFDGAQTDGQILSSLTERGIGDPEIIEVEAPVSADQDEDGVPDPVDNCPADPNQAQEDLDQSGVGDACDSSPDSDGDGIADPGDNCPDIFNSDQNDDDEDGTGDLCAGLPEVEVGE